MPKVVLYTKDYCRFCAQAKELLNSRGAEFTEIDVTHDADLQAEMIKRAGRRTVPQIFIDDRHVGGFDDLKALDAVGGLDPLLDGGRKRPGRRGITVLSFSAADRRAIRRPSMPRAPASSRPSSPGWRSADS